MGRLHIRPMARSDLPQVEAIFASYDLLRGKPLKHVFDTCSGSPGAIYLVGEMDGEVVGGLLAQFNGFHVFLSHMAVAEHVQGRGIGARMHKELEHRAKKLGAQGIIADARMSAVGFYERLDYKIPGAVFLIRRFDTGKKD